MGKASENLFCSGIDNLVLKDECDEENGGFCVCLNCVLFDFVCLFLMDL